VLTVPHRLRYRIGCNHELCKRFLRVLGRELQTYYRTKTDRRDGHSGSVTFVQRFNSGLALSPHYHVIAMDGVFVDDGKDWPLVDRAMGARLHWSSRLALLR
jgi:hypothetical protein